jgi:hypothetical protein
VFPLPKGPACVFSGFGQVVGAPFGSPHSWPMFRFTQLTLGACIEVYPL